MQVARVFKLIKEYPGSPKIGDRVIEILTMNSHTVKFLLASSIDKPNLITFSEDQITNFPEFWELAT